MKIKFLKYAPTAWVLSSDQPLQIGATVDVPNRHGKDVECIPYKFVFERERSTKNPDGTFTVWREYIYSYIRADGKNAQTIYKDKADDRRKWAEIAEEKSTKWFLKAQEGSDFLQMGQPILVGHHSEKRHRNLIQRNWDRMRNSVEFSNLAEEHRMKSEYYEAMENYVDLSMPESMEYFEVLLELAKERHEGLKKGTIKRDHSYSLTYANKRVKDLEFKIKVANVLWNLEEGN